MIPSRLSAPTRPVHDVRSCIVERVWVETPVDTDGDGMADLIAVYIRRPLACDDGLVVPAIYVADPYMLGCDDDGYAPHPTDVELGGAQSAGTGAGDTTAPAGRGAEADSPAWPDPDPDPRARFGAEQPSPAMARGRFRTPRGTGPAHRLAPDEMPELECISDYYAFYNSCGYATVFAGGLGTRGSQGFNDCGSPRGDRRVRRRDRLAQRARPRVHESRRRHRGARRLGQRQGRHDRQKLPGHNVRGACRRGR